MKEIINFDPNSIEQVMSLMENELFRGAMAGLFSSLFDISSKYLEAMVQESEEVTISVNGKEGEELLYTLVCKPGYIPGEELEETPTQES